MNIKMKQPSVKLMIFVLMICTFSIGYTEYAVMGILTSIADTCIFSGHACYGVRGKRLPDGPDRNHYRG